MKIYRVLSDNNFWALFAVNRDFYKGGKLFKVRSMRDSWVTTTFYPRDPVRTKRGDFFNVALAALAYGKNVLQSELGEIIETSGEVLPATLDETGEEIYILNPTACYNCLDRKNTVARWIPDGTLAVEVKKFAFHADRIGDANLFKIPETHGIHLYALAGRDEPEDEFYSQYHALGFTGLKFEELWTDELANE